MDQDEGWGAACCRAKRPKRGLGSGTGCSNQAVDDGTASHTIRALEGQIPPAESTREGRK